jgi:hypothetical protein
MFCTGPDLVHTRRPKWLKQWIPIKYNVADGALPWDEVWTGREKQHLVISGLTKLVFLGVCRGHIGRTMTWPLLRTFWGGF